MRLFPDAKVKEGALDYLLNKGMMTGQERAYCMRPELDIALVGIDDERLFTGHKSIGAEVAKVKDRAVALTAHLVESLFAQCDSVLARDFRDFMSLCREYDRGRTGYTEYLSQLYWYARLNGVRISPTLLRRMAQGGIVPSAAARDIEGMSGSVGLTSSEEDTSETELRQDIASTLCRTDLDFRFFRIVTSCELMGDAFQAKLSAQRARRFLGLAVEDVRGTFLDDLRCISSCVLTCGVGAASDLQPFVIESEFLWDSWNVPAGYYRAAKSRSHVMAQRTNREMAAHSVDKAMIVVGGFHSFHCCRDLSKKYGMACLTVTPTVESIETPDYWRRISGELLTEEQILADAQRIQEEGGTPEEQVRRWIGS